MRELREARNKFAVLGERNGGAISVISVQIMRFIHGESSTNPPGRCCRELRRRGRAVKAQFPRDPCLHVHERV